MAFLFNMFLAAELVLSSNNHLKEGNEFDFLYT